MIALDRRFICGRYTARVERTPEGQISVTSNRDELAADLRDEDREIWVGSINTFEKLLETIVWFGADIASDHYDRLLIRVFDSIGDGS